MENTGEGFAISTLKRLEHKQVTDARVATERKIGDRDQHYAFVDSGLEIYNQYLFGGEGSVAELVTDIHKAHPDKPVKILDYGCGSNQMARELFKKIGSTIPIDITGISVGDPRTKEDIEYDAKSGIKFVNQDTSRFELIPNSFDLILSRSTMLHLVDPLRTLKELYSALSMGGELRADFSINNLVDKFYDGKDVDGAYQEARELIRQLQGSGVDIQLDERGLSLRKNSSRLQIQSLKYSKPLNEKGNGLYKLVRNTPGKNI